MAPGARVEDAGVSFHDLVQIRDRRVREEVNLIRRELKLEQCVVSDAVNIAVAARGEVDHAVSLRNAAQSSAPAPGLPRLHHLQTAWVEGEQVAGVGGTVDVTGTGADAQRGGRENGGERE